jgi:WD40 repeat protein
MGSLIAKCSYILVTHGNHVQVWNTPSYLAREFAPFVLHRTYTGHFDEVLSVEWSKDSRYVSACPEFRRDLTD